ncbi:MAG: flotillin family protein [Acidobacteriota bacterium]
MDGLLIAGVLTIVVIVLIAIGVVVGYAAFYRKVPQGKALIINKQKRVDVTFTGGVVIPILHKAEVMDISVKTIEIDRRGTDGLICRDNIRADIKVTFFVKVNGTQEDVKKVAQAIGCDRASDQMTLDELFNAKFSEALKTVGKRLDFVDLYTKRDDFRDWIIEVIGTDLNGYSLEDAAIDYLEQTPLDQLDPKNILDAQGIRKITELTAVEAISTNEYKRNEEKRIKAADVEAREAILELERRQAEAEAKQQNEIESVRARELAETHKIQQEERLKAESARLKTDEDIAIQEENLKRQVDVAAKNRERVVAVETERVEKDRMLEQIARERETELQAIAKEKEVEVEKREIANVIRERIAVEKTVAEQEESIKRLRMVEEASRVKEASIITAEAEAEEKLVKDIKAAEAAEKAAVFTAKERITLANADLEAADITAKAKIRLAEGTKAEAAAPGLAEAQVKEADAAAEEKQGMARARVKVEDASAAEKQGLAEATVLREKGFAEAEALEKHGLAEAEALEKRGLAEAEALEKRGLAEALALEKKLLSEASGLTEKAKAMAALDEASREHEEYRLRLEMDKEVELARIDNQRQIAEAQAGMLSAGLESANVNIVGGESVFFDRLMSAITTGKQVDAVADSETMSALLRHYTDGDGNLVADLKGVLGGATEVRDLTVTALLAKLMSTVDGKDRGKVERLLRTAQELGLDRLELGSGGER